MLQEEPYHISKHRFPRKNLISSPTCQEKRKRKYQIQGLSKMLYLKFCTATKGSRKFCPYFPFKATISPQAPPTFELISKAFQR